MFFWSLLLVSLSLFSFTSQAQDKQFTAVPVDLSVDVLVGSVSHNQLLQLANNQQWLQLLHYRQHPFSIRQRFRSQNDDVHFFLHQNGATDPLAELMTSIQVMTSSDADELDQADSSDVQDNNQRPQCRFPARFFWLQQQLPQLPWRTIRCDEFETWRDEINAASLTLIFPASHINSPSSMYGHTFIRLDRQDPNASKLLAASVNFAANHDPTDNELVFTYKGLSGGYPGQVSVSPYYTKTNRYQHMEYRDTWEYPLSFTQAEVDQFVRHIWETKETFFDYFFFDENCSYRLLTLLDAASPRSNLADQFLLKAVPVDTIRALYEQNFVVDAIYRPSAASQMEYLADQSNAEQISVARQLVNAEYPSHLSAKNYRQLVEQSLRPFGSEKQAQILDLAVAYSRYLSIKKKKSLPQLRHKTLTLLSARSQRPTYLESDSGLDSGTKSVPAPQYRDDQGHKTQRVKIAAVATPNMTDPTVTEIHWRPAYHAIEDPVRGFDLGAQIEMADINIRVSSDGRVSLQQLDLIDVLSLSHQTELQRPNAWGVSAGLDRLLDDKGIYSRVGWRVGKAYSLLNSNAASRVFAMVDSQIAIDNQFNEGYQVAAGPLLGWLMQADDFQILIQADRQLMTGDQIFGGGDDRQLQNIHALMAHQVTPNMQLGIRFDRQWQFDRDQKIQNDGGVLNQFKFEFSVYH